MMKRIVFLLIIFTLLLCAQWLSMIGTKAAPQHGIKVQSLGFFYKLDENARYLDLKTQWQTANRGFLPKEKAIEFARQAYADSSVESMLTQWRYQGGPAPRIFDAKLHLYNDTTHTFLNLPIQVAARVQVGDLRVSSATQLTDYEYLSKTAHWEALPSRSITIPAFAPNEDQQVGVYQFKLLEFLDSHPDQWPLKLQITVSSPSFGQVNKILMLKPDHFVVKNVEL